MPVVFKGLCIKVRSDDKCRYFFLKIEDSMYDATLQCVKELDAFEFENMEDDPEYFVCRLS